MTKIPNILSSFPIASFIYNHIINLNYQSISAELKSQMLAYFKSQEDKQ
jgi:hypothetical protein